MKHMLEKIENIFLTLGFKTEFVGEKQLRYLRYQDCFCKVTPLEQWNAFVIESANNVQDAEKQVLEDGEIYYMDTPETELLHQVEEDIKKFYM